MPHSTFNFSEPPLPQGTPQSSDQPTSAGTATTFPPPPANPTLRTLNRRRTYLAQHPDYFVNPDLEYINPLLYDRCVRAFLSAEDREAAGKERGWSAVLEAGLRRGEARLERLRERDLERQERGEAEKEDDDDDDDDDDVARDKEEGERIWREAIGERFVKGEDEDFDYGTVDDDEALDVEERRDYEEAWFDGEEESAVGIEGQTGIQDF